MINAKAFKGLEVRTTGQTTRNVLIAVWGAVFGKSSIMYVPTRHIAKYVEGEMRRVCEVNSLDYEYLRNKMLVRVPETRGVRADMVLIDDSLQTAIYEGVRFE